MLVLLIVDSRRLRHRIVRELIIVGPSRGRDPELIGFCRQKYERREETTARGPIVEHLRHRRLQADIAPIEVRAGVVREPAGVASDGELIVSGALRSTSQ